MKKIVAIIMMAFAIIAGGATADAKTTKKKSTASSSVKFEMLSDGYPNIGGHTYTGNLQGYKMTVTFGPYTGTNSEVYIKISYKGQWEEELNNWYYEGDGVIMFYMDAGVPVYCEIRNGGKELYNEEANFTLKAIK